MAQEQKKQDLASQIWTDIRKVSRTLVAVAKTDPEIAHLGYTEFVILDILSNHDKMPISKVASLVSLTSGSMTTAVDRLEKRELVARSFHPTDRRVRYISLTDQGKDAVKRQFALHRKLMSIAVDALNPEEQKNLVEYLQRIADRAQTLL